MLINKELRVRGGDNGESAGDGDDDHEAQQQSEIVNLLKQLPTSQVTIIKTILVSLVAKRRDAKNGSKFL